jgi:chemotaxis protein MotB
MIKKAIILINSILTVLLFMACQTTYPAETSDTEGLKKEISDLKKQIAKDDNKNQQEVDKTKKANDLLTESLKNEIQRKQIVINQYRDVLTINISEEIFFDSGSADIKKEGFNVLNRIGNILKYFPDKMIKIEGHTDNVPISESHKHNFANNWVLGAIRAVNVAVYFENELSVNPQRLEVTSFSKYRPLVPNTSDYNRAKNRRIEIVLINKNMYMYQTMGMNQD